jgi:hypothetical protein
MAEIPINIRPGVYSKPGEREITGLCIMIDNQDAQWEVTASDNYTTIIKITHNAKWNVQEYTDPKTGNRMLQIFREGAKLNRMAQEFVNPAEGAYTQDASAASGGGPVLNVYYTTPEDSHTSPKKIKAS